MDEQRNAIFVARKEFTTHLIYLIYPAIYQGLKAIWDDSKKSVPARLVFSDFQHRLARVRKWNQDVIENEYKRIVKKSNCEYLEDLIKRVFVLNTQILAAVNMSHIDPNKRIKVKVPKGEKFIHHCYKECARSFFENVLLMEDRVNSISRVEQAKNLQKAYKLIMTCIENTIRNMLPIESLLKNSLEDNEEGEDATPPAMLVNFTKTIPSHQVYNRQTPPSQSHMFDQTPHNPVTSHPTIGTFLHNPSNLHGGKTFDSGDNSNIMTPSTGSLQPSMNELGSISFPTNGVNHETSMTKEYKNDTFDPSSLFEPEVSDTQDKEVHKDSLSPKHDHEHEHDTLDHQSDDTDLPEKPDTSLSSQGMTPAIVEESTKTIFLNRPFGRRLSSTSVLGRVNTENMNSKELTNKNDMNSQDSDGSDEGIAHNKKDIGGQDVLDQPPDILPVVKKVHNEKIDLDVFSSNDELHLPSSSYKFEDKPSIDEVSKQSLPSIENVEKENFFSDVE